MINKDNLYITIPLYNESKMIKKVLVELKKNGYRNIVVVDDGSRDSSYEAARQMGVIVARHSVNRGQGAAIQTAVEIALSRGARYIVHFDSDGQHDVKDIGKMFQTLVLQDLDIVLGSRFLRKGNNVPLSKRILLRGGIVFTYVISGLWLTDVHNGIRVMTSETANKLDIQYDRMEHASEILDKVSKLKLNYKEVPVNIKYTRYSTGKDRGQSVFNSVSIAFNMVLSKITK